MLCVMRVLNSIGLKVQKPMTLWVDNKGAVDLANSLSIGGRTRHVDVRMHFLREPKEEGTMITRWISGDQNPSDSFGENMPFQSFEKHVKLSVVMELRRLWSEELTNPGRVLRVEFVSNSGSPKMRFDRFGQILVNLVL